MTIKEYIYQDSNNRKYLEYSLKKYFHCMVGVLILSFLGLIFIPTTKEMAAIQVIPKIVNNEKVQNIGNKFYTLTTDWLKELSPKK